MRSFAVWLVVACTFLAVPAMPAIAQSRVTGTQVDALLGAYEGVEPAQWRGLGKGAIPILESIAADQSVLPTRRARSVDGLAALGSGERTMRTLANSNTEPLIVRMSAVRGLGQLLPGAALIDALRPLLQDPQWQVRGIAAETLSYTPGGCAVVADMAKQETDAWRYRFLRHCGEQPTSTTTTTPQALTSGDPTSTVIVYRITDPTATKIYDYAQPASVMKVRPPTLPGSFAVLVPNAPNISLLSGSWKYNLFASAPTTVNVEALIKSPSFVPLTSGTVNANLFFVGVNGLTAASAPADANFQAILSKVNAIYAQIGLQLGNLTYIDITGADATTYTDIADDTELAGLMRLSASPQASDFAINLFFVHSITGGMGGYVILGESAGIPGVPIRGSSGSGVAVTMADFPNGLDDIASTFAHEGGHWLGLFHTTESGGTSFDPLPDTPQCPKVPNDVNNDGFVDAAECAALDGPNLMFWTSFGGQTQFTVTPNQQFVEMRNPVVNVPGTHLSGVQFGAITVSNTTLINPIYVNVPAIAASVTLIGDVTYTPPDPPPAPPTVWHVDSAADTTDGICGEANCTLRDALSDAQPGDTIVFSSLFSTPQTINLGSALPAIAGLTITGPGANLLTVRANASGFSVLTVASGTVSISGLTIANGSSSQGGGIENHGYLTLTDSVVSGNHADNGGGGIYNDGTVLVGSSTFVGNDASRGGALYNTGVDGTAALINTTLSANSTNGSLSYGTAVENESSTGGAPYLQLLNCTIADNFGLFDAVGASGNGATITVQNTLFARNSHASLAVYSGGVSVTSLGNNLATDNGGGFLNGAGDLKFTDPLLASTLRNNGGRTPTYLLAPNSPAINAGGATGAPSDDQRHVPRTSVDIGAVELRPLVITSAADPGDGTCDGTCTLRDAILTANAGDAAAHDVFFNATFNTPQSINLSAVLPSIAKGITLNGPGANLLTVRRDTGGDYRIFTINSAFATISGMTIANGKNGFGGGIANFATLTLDRVTLTGNLGTTNGGAMQNTGLLVVTNSTFSGNTAGHAGALYNYASSGASCTAGCSATLTNTTITGNTATVLSGGITDINFGNSSEPTVTLINSTVAGNIDATNEVGLIAWDSGGRATIYLQNTIVADNTGTFDLANGGGANSYVVSLGNNLALSDGGGYFLAPGDVVNTNPKLTTLGNYGGTTQTLYPKPGSPAINAGSDIAAPDSDQRGVLRPVGAHVDIGAVESDGTLVFQDGFDGS